MPFRGVEKAQWYSYIVSWVCNLRRIIRLVTNEDGRRYYLREKARKLEVLAEKKRQEEA